MRHFGGRLDWVLAGVFAAVLSACTAGTVRPGAAVPSAPYPKSRLIASVTWDFSRVDAQRKALGSDLWPCAWAADGALYCAWGDGGGFDGNDDQIGRASLGFARLTGTPSADDAEALSGKNVWGSPPYAEAAATFGGKVGSIIGVNGVLYAIGGFWTREDSNDPVHKSGRGPRNTVAWSSDFARSWQLAPWTSPTPLGAFLDAGRDSSGIAPAFVYAYYLRAGDSRHLYLERIRSDAINWDPRIGVSVEYFAGRSLLGRSPRWSRREAQATPMFADRNNVEGPSVVYDAVLGRYLLTAGHYASGHDDDSSAGQVGLFESRHPWGPWRTIGYYEDWGGFNTETRGDYLSLRIPSKWISADGKSLWAVFSGLKSFDSFNMVHGALEVR